MDNNTPNKEIHSTILKFRMMMGSSISVHFTSLTISGADPGFLERGFICILKESSNAYSKQFTTKS